jgi:hypothetical protein
LPLKQAAQKANRSEKTLMRWGEQGLIRLYRGGPRLIDVDEGDLEEALNKPLEPIPFPGKRYQKIKARETA